jgi:hypothetical protein
MRSEETIQVIAGTRERTFAAVFHRSLRCAVRELRSPASVLFSVGIKWNETPQTVINHGRDDGERRPKSRTYLRGNLDRIIGSSEAKPRDALLRSVIRDTVWNCIELGYFLRRCAH